MGITLDGVTVAEGQVVESISLSGPIERQTMGIGGWDAAAEKAAVKNLDPGSAAYALAVRTLPRMTTSNPVMKGRFAAGATPSAIAANATRLDYSVENDDSGGDGTVYVNEGSVTASATVWVCRLQAGERWSPKIWTGLKISVFVVGSALAHCVEWVA